jgi:hypothetical protein
MLIYNTYVNNINYKFDKIPKPNNRLQSSGDSDE